MTVQLVYTNIQDRISNHRFFFMGIAMMFVVLYHAYCAIPQIYLLSIFKWGYVGVDIFLFFSGFGCARSFTSNSWMIYIRNRIKKIIPLYWVWAIVHLVGFCMIGKYVPSIMDIFGLFTTLSYYGVGAIRANWYLSALLLMYILLPLIYFIAKSSQIIFPILSYILAFGVIRCCHPVWYYDAFIGRIPIFILGICTSILMTRNRNSSTLMSVCIYLCMFVCGSYLLRKGYMFISTALICPLLLIVLSMLPNRIIEYKPIIYIGNHTLEIFIANCWTMLIMPLIDMNLYWCLAIYMVSNIILSIFLILLNKLIVKITS